MYELQTISFITVNDCPIDICSRSASMASKLFKPEISILSTNSVFLTLGNISLLKYL